MPTLVDGGDSSYFEGEAGPPLQESQGSVDSEESDGYDDDFRAITGVNIDELLERTLQDVKLTVM